MGVLASWSSWIAKISGWLDCWLAGPFGWLAGLLGFLAVWLVCLLLALMGFLASWFAGCCARWLAGSLIC
jgi:hypothetical protein